MGTAVPLGLIVNELVSNSLKHAFSGRGRVEIRIKICRDTNFKNKAGSSIENRTENLKSTKFILTVSDGGTSIPETINMEKSSFLGLQLVNILVDQLDGEMKIKRERNRIHYQDKCCRKSVKFLPFLIDLFTA